MEVTLMSTAGGINEKYKDQYFNQNEVDFYKTLDDYLKSEIRPMYKFYDFAHDTNHFDEVYETAKKLADADVFMGKLTNYDMYAVMIAAAYHDTGLLGRNNREDHEIYSKNFLNRDMDLLHLFLNEAPFILKPDINLIYKKAKIAIINHRTSKDASCEIDQILKDADSVSLLDINRTLSRICDYYMMHQYTEKETADKIVRDRLRYLNTKIYYKMRTKFVSNAAIEINLKPNWKPEDVTYSMMLDSVKLSIAKYDAYKYMNG